MKAYVITTCNHADNACKVSQTAYRTLQLAQAFCASRSDKPAKYNEFTYKSADTTYWIIDIDIEGR